MPSTIIVCDTCAHAPGIPLDDQGRRGGEVLAAALEELAGAVPVRRHSCLMGCERPCNVAITAPGKMSYVLGGFAPGPEAAQALIDYARLHGDSAQGVVPYKQWPQGVKGHFHARIPPLPDV